MGTFEREQERKGPKKKRKGGTCEKRKQRTSKKRRKGKAWAATPQNKKRQKDGNQENVGKAVRLLNRRFVVITGGFSNPPAQHFPPNHGLFPAEDAGGL